MNYKLLKAKNEIFIDSARLYIEAIDRKGNVSKEFVSKLAAFRIPLSLIISDKHLGAIAKKTLEAVNAALEYIDTKDEKALERTIAAHRASDALIHKFRGELVLGDVINGN